MNKFTRGPWEAAKHGDYSDYNGRCIVVLGDDCTVRVAVVLGGNDEETNATARLIAAAPDLLKAIKYARRFLRKEDHDTDYVDAVIAKATGEPQ